MTAVAQERLDVGRLIVATAAAIFLILPFLTTFNELLTAIIRDTGLYRPFERFVVPILSKMVAAVLGFFGLESQVAGPVLYVSSPTGSGGKGFYLAWNCTGWQSIVLLVATLLTGLKGDYTWRSRIITIIIGLEGTILLNLFRISFVAIFSIYLGAAPAIVFHDYFATLLTLVWILYFWHLAENHLLTRITDFEETTRAGQRFRSFVTSVRNHLKRVSPS